MPITRRTFFAGASTAAGVLAAPSVLRAQSAETELGWGLEHVAWGHGYATEAAIAVRDWALREVQPRRLISLIHPENVRSIRVAEKIGEHYQHDIVMHHGATVQLWALPSRP